MLIVISPAKTLDFEKVNETLPMTEPQFLIEAKELVHEGLRTAGERAQLGTLESFCDQNKIETARIRAVVDEFHGPEHNAILHGDGGLEAAMERAIGVTHVQVSSTSSGQAPNGAPSASA